MRDRNNEARLANWDRIERDVRNMAAAMPQWCGEFMMTHVLVLLQTVREQNAKEIERRDEAIKLYERIDSLERAMGTLQPPNPAARSGESFMIVNGQKKP